MTKANWASQLKIALVGSVAALTLAGCATTATQAEADVSDAAEVVEDTASATFVQAAPKPTYGTFGMDEAGMDKSVAPGDDFYAYANGTWAKTTQIPADKANYGMFSVLDDLSKSRTREILDAANSNPDSKIGRAYATYLDESAVEAKGLAPIEPWLNEVRALKTKAQYAALAAKADRMGIGGVNYAYVGQDDKNPETYMVVMGQAGLGMPDRDYYLSDAAQFSDKRAKYITHLENMLTLMGEANAPARAKAVYDFETKIARAHWTKTESRDADKTYNKMTVAALSKLAPGYDYAGWLKGIGANVTDVIVSQPSALKGIAQAVNTTALPALRDQMLIRSLGSFAGSLPDRVTKENFAFYGTALSGTPEMEPRWKRAVSYTVGGLSDDVSKEYVARFYPPETKAAMDELVKNVVSAMGRRIDGLDWMAPATKQSARGKLAAFTTKIGYPDRWQDYGSVDVKAGDLFGNTVRMRHWGHEDQLSKLGQPIRRWEWGMTPMEINAYANFGMNEIVFPAAILQPPFFDPKADPAMNYGGIGAVIGHEISHHFDDQGSKYDATGKLTTWWTPADVTAFKAAAKQLADQYNQYEVLPGQKLNGEFTMGENIGDLAGLAVAYDAYKASLGGKEAPVINGMTGDQRFYLGWAQVWRRNYREANLSQRITTDPHSPSIQRTWSVRNQDPWYDAYGVKAGNKLYLPSEQRVRIW